MWISQKLDLAFRWTLRKIKKVIDEFQFLVIISIKFHFQHSKKEHFAQKALELSKFFTTSSKPIELQNLHFIWINADSLISYTVQPLEQESQLQS